MLYFFVLYFQRLSIKVYVFFVVVVVLSFSGILSTLVKFKKGR